MKQLISAALSVILTLAALPSYANTPEPTFDQTRDWVVATIAESAGYTHDATAVTYKDVSMEGCQLRFTTFTTTPTGYSDAETTTFSLDSVKTIIWGTASNPLRGYVIFTAAAPISLNRQRVWRVLDRQPQTINASTTIAYLEFGKPGADYAGLASHMKAAILHAADLCKVQVAAK
jgi:hypothetical protein